MINFKITDWFYWGEFYCDSTQPYQENREKTFDLAGITPIQRRRFPEVAKKLNPFFLKADKNNEPVIYTSRDGQIAKTMAIIRGFSDEVSPAKFSMSVHNAIPGLLSATHKSTLNYQTIDSMSGSIEMALFEASALLYQTPVVNVFYFEEITPTEWGDANNNKLQSSVVLGLRITAGNDYGLAQTTAENGQTGSSEAGNIERLFGFLRAAEETTLQTNYSHKTWQWQRFVG